MTVEVLERTQTSAGTQNTWTPTKEMWAAINTVSAAAKAHLHQIGNPDVQLRMAFREDPGIEYGKARFRWKGRVLYPRGEVENIDGQRKRFTLDVGEREL